MKGPLFPCIRHSNIYGHAIELEFVHHSRDVSAVAQVRAGLLIIPSMSIRSQYRIV